MAVVDKLSGLPVSAWALAPVIEKAGTAAGGWGGGTNGVLSPAPPQALSATVKAIRAPRKRESSDDTKENMVTTLAR
jgi:hypothetical protein